MMPSSSRAAKRTREADVVVDLKPTCLLRGPHDGSGMTNFGKRRKIDDAETASHLLKLQEHQEESARWRALQTLPAFVKAVQNQKRYSQRWGV